MCIIAIARAFLRKAPLLLLDEATSALDTESEALVQNAIDALIKRGGCTVVLVAHRLSTVINANVIAVMDKGRIIEQGNHDHVINQSPIPFILVSMRTATYLHVCCLNSYWNLMVHMLDW
jgi:ABC-type multidrug transport system fused ATPase/permease subunit